MKIKHELAILHYATGQKQNGSTYHYLQVQDEDGYKYTLFGDKAQEYIKTNYGEIKELNIEIKTYYDAKLKKTNTIYSLI